MTQNTEQNVRTRDEQIEALTSQFGEEGTFSYVDDRDAATKHILEAEARGAAEQRRKDAEGQEPASWQAFCPHVRQWLDVGKDYVHHYQKMGQEVRPLYTHSANVAALEARVKALEEYYEAAEAISVNASSEQCDRLDKARASLTREGGV